MDYKAETSESQNKSYQTLGKKVFWLFFLQISPITFILLILSIIIFVTSFQPFLINTSFGNIQNTVLSTGFFVFILSIILAIACSIIAWLTYVNYTFMIGEDSFRIKRGVFNKTENAIPYHQIQNVDIERNLSFQALGLSRLIILTAGHEDETVKSSDEAEGIIPAVDQKVAIWLQSELLKRANIQKTAEVSNQNATTR